MNTHTFMHRRESFPVETSACREYFWQMHCLFLSLDGDTSNLAMFSFKKLNLVCPAHSAGAVEYTHCIAEDR